MLPPFLKSSYKTYKDDTNAVASWLALTAKQCGYPVDLLSTAKGPDSRATQATSGRLKGKARKAAKDAAQNEPAQATSSASAKSPRYIIKIKEFITLAEYVSAHEKPPVRVPHGLTKTLHRAISLRKKHGELKQDASVSTTHSDEKHGYFLGVLERVMEILKPRMPSSLADDTLTWPESDVGSQTQDQEDAGGLGNMFNGMDIEEPSPAFLDAPDIKREAKKDSRDEPTFEAESAASEEEECMALHCLFQDIKQIRWWVKQLWRNYEEGSDLVAVSVTVNTAIDFVRSLGEEFERSFPHRTGFKSMVRLYYTAQCVARGQHPGNKERPGDLVNFKLFDVVDEAMMGTFSSLSSFQDIIQPGVVPLYQPGALGTRNRRTRWFSKSPREKFADDQLNIFESLPQIYLFNIIGSKNPLVTDELMRGLEKLRPHAEIPVWLVFAVQCFLDSHHVLEDAIERPFQQLVQTSKMIENSITNTLKFHESLRVETWPRSNDAIFKQLLWSIEQWVKKDVVAEKFRTVRQTSLRTLVPQLIVNQMPQARMIPAPEPHGMLRSNPLLCGLIMFNFKMRAQDLGVSLANAWSSILTTAQIYNAVRQEKLLSLPWKDMEMLISLQSEETFFVGEHPKSPEEYVKRFALNMGYSATNFAKDHRENAPIASKKGPRGLSELCPTAKLCVGRYCENNATVAWTREAVELIFKSKLEDDGNATEKATDDKAPTGAKDKSKEKQSASGGLIRMPKKLFTSRPAVEFLEVLANALQAEELEMSFDYLLMHRFCWMLLRTIHEACRPQLLMTFGSGYIEQENQLPFVVGYIFMTCSQISRLANLIKKKPEGTAITSQVLVTAATAVRQMIEGGAGDFVMRMLEKQLDIELDSSEIC